MANGYFVEELLGLLGQLEPERSEADLSRLKAELKRRLPPLNQDTVPGLINSVTAGRIANRLNLHGPAYMIDAACASSLLAVEHGMRALRDGRCDAVLAGGVQASTPPVIQAALAQVGALSPFGRITPFSREASGMLAGEGCGILVLMRRGDAERSGYRIYCLLKGMGTSSDGKGSGLLAPRHEGQRLAVERAYEDAEICPTTVTLLEAHGTGTPVGDAVELETIFQAFSKRTPACPRVAMGTVKSMIGHLLPAAGAASLIKTALALYHRTLPPTLHCEQAVERLQATDSPIYLVSERRPARSSPSRGQRLWLRRHQRACGARGVSTPG
jgi:acyl transferase domain-containing protein